jgi:hypothetical protein
MQQPEANLAIVDFFDFQSRLLALLEGRFDEFLAHRAVGVVHDFDVGVLELL